MKKKSIEDILNDGDWDSFINTVTKENKPKKYYFYYITTLYNYSSNGTYELNETHLKILHFCIEKYGNQEELHRCFVSYLFNNIIKKTFKKINLQAKINKF
jgi:hypothetical protein